MKKWIKYIIVAAAALFVVGSMMSQGTWLLYLVPNGNGRQPEKFNWQKMFYLNPDEYLRSK